MASYVRQTNSRGQEIGWQARVVRKGQRLTKVFKTFGEAEAWAIAREKELLVDKRLIDRNLMKMVEKRSLADLIDQYLVWYKSKPNLKPMVLRTKESRLLWWRDHTGLGPRMLANLEPEDFAAVRDKRLSDGAAPSTVHHDLSEISSVYEQAIETFGYRRTGLTNPMRGFTWPSLKAASRKRRMATSEGTRILQHLSMKGPEWLYLAVKLALLTTIRQGELINLRWENVDLDEKSIFLSADRTKTNEARYVPLSTAAVGVLMALQKLYPPVALAPQGKPDLLEEQYQADLVRHGDAMAVWNRRLDAAWEKARTAARADGRPVPETLPKWLRASEVGPQPRRPVHPRLIFQGLVDGAGTLRWWWKKTCAAVGVKDLRWHDLRREGISMGGRGGLSLAEQMKLSGHTTLGALEHYDRPHLDDVGTKLDSIHAEWMGRLEGPAEAAAAPASADLSIEKLRAVLLARGTPLEEVNAIIGEIG